MTRPLGSVTVVGASLAGHATARALRDEGFEGRITLIGDEPHRPYDRPPLSKGFLAGTTSPAELSLEDDERDLGLEWELGTAAVALDTGTRTVTLADGRTVTSEAIVVATGSRARRLPAGLGGTLGGVHTIRTVEDALALRADLRPGARLVLVGAGFVGAEIAATAHRLGLDVTLLEAAETPLLGQLGAEAGAMVARLHADHGVALHCGVPVQRLTGETRSTGQARVTGVRLADGRCLEADVVVVGVGSEPALDWLDGSGLDLGLGPRRGLGCDLAGFTGAPGIYGVGDCAAWFDPVLGRRCRIEHWTDAHDRPLHTVRSLLGVEDRSAPVSVPYFWSDQYGVRIQFAGRRFGDEQISVEAGGPDTGDALVVYRRDGRPTAVLAMNQPRLFARARRQLSAEPVAA